MALLYRQAGRLTARNGDFWPGQVVEHDGSADKPFCEARDYEDVPQVSLGLAYEARRPAAAPNLLTAESIAAMCIFERQVLAYAGSHGVFQKHAGSPVIRGYCLRRTDDDPAAPCCRPHSLASALEVLVGKPCDTLTDAEIAAVALLVARCSIESSCIPSWPGHSCKADADCAAVDPCQRERVECSAAGVCVSACDVPHGSIPPLGHLSDDELHYSLGGNWVWFFTNRLLDKDFGPANLATRYSKASVPFINTGFKQVAGQDMSMVQSAGQLVSLYEDMLEPAYLDASMAVTVASQENTLQMDQMKVVLVHDVERVIFALVIVFVIIWLQVGSLFVTSLGMLHVLLAFPSAYTFYRVVLGIRWMPLFNYIGLFVAIGLGADPAFADLGPEKLFLGPKKSLSTRVPVSLELGFTTIVAVYKYVLGLG
jgi:hypothetical protein